MGTTKKFLWLLPVLALAIGCNKKTEEGATTSLLSPSNSLLGNSSTSAETPKPGETPSPFSQPLVPAPRTDVNPMGSSLLGSASTSAKRSTKKLKSRRHKKKKHGKHRRHAKRHRRHHRG